MIFNCTNCGISVSTKRANCTYCRASNIEIIEMMEGRAHASINAKEKMQLKERNKGTIFSLVLR
jgi:uncharacterized OB-fold protein